MVSEEGAKIVLNKRVNFYKIFNIISVVCERETTFNKHEGYYNGKAW